MTKNFEKRLGCVPGIGEVAINKHPFFASVDWRKMSLRQVQPPFQPKVVSLAVILNMQSGCVNKSVSAVNF